MASFLLQSIQKSFLFHALSSIEILDTDALDLNNLDITLGKRNVIEFKNAPLRLKVLTNLLQLPPEFELTKSQIRLLRITVPLDFFYSSPVVVELDGVEVKLRVLGDSDKENKKKGSTAYEREKSRKRRGGNAPNEDGEGGLGLPTAKDLAASFLETRPEEEKEELEAAISQTSPHLESGDDEDEDEETGTGTNPGLPTRLGNYLKGVVDRMEVRIRNVVFHTDFQIPNDNGFTDPVTVQLNIDDVDIEGITYEKRDEPELSSPSVRRFTPKEGKRFVNLRKIRGTLISEATVFTSLAKSSSLSSPSTTHSEYSKSRSSSRYTARSNKSARHRSEHFASSEELSHPARYRATNTADQMVHDEYEAPLASSVVASEGGRFDDAFDEEQEGADELSTALDSISSVSTSSILQGSRISHSSTFFDQVSRSRKFEPKFDNDNEESDSENALAFGSQDQGAGESSATPRASSRASFLESQHDGNPRDVRNLPYHASSLKSDSSPTTQRTRFSDERVSQNEYLSRSEKQLDNKLGNFENSSEYEGVQKDDDSSSTTSSPKQDLAQSMMFSHEEAASMYMSAMSDNPVISRMPGGWDDEGSENLPDFSPSASPRPTQISRIPAGNSVASQESPDVERGFSNPKPSNIEVMDSDTQNSVPSPGRRHSVAAEQASRGPVPSMQKVMSNVSEASRASSDGYSRVAKCIFRLDEVAVYLPPLAPTEVPINQNMEHSASASSGPSDGSRSSGRGVPGAFSAYSNERRPEEAPTGPEKPDHQPESQPELFEILLGSLDAHFDVSVGRLMTRIGLVVSECLNKGAAPPGDIPKADVSSSKLRAKFRGEKLSLKFLDRLAGTFFDATSYSEQEPWDVPPDPDVLLQTSLEGLEVETSRADGTTKTSVRLEKFLFGYATENIISFDLGLRMYESVRDVASSKRHDLEVKIEKTPETTRVSVNTLPVCVAIDLQRLDETFSWFGGLSGVMNMGSSVASNATMTAITPIKAVPKPRGVRFDAPIKPDDKSVAAENKVDARIGGFVLQLVGQECSVSVETSAVKIVSREEGIGMAVDTIRLSGPHIHTTNDEPAVNAEFNGTRVEFFTSPKDKDLDRLLSLITPSNAKYDQDDDIMVDTLLRQRKKGSVLRLTVDRAKMQVGQLDDLRYLPELGNELSKLSTVAKYLPEDDRPGLLSLVLVRSVEAEVDVNAKFGKLQLGARDIEVAQITLPSLIAFSMASITLARNGNEELIGPAPGPALREPELRSPAVMARLIGDEMEPVIKVKLWNLRIEYSIPTLVAFLDLSADANGEEVSAELASSIATLTEGFRSAAQGNSPSRNVTPGNEIHSSSASPLDFDVVVRDCVIGLNPLGLPSKILVVMTEARVSAALPKNQNLKATAELSKASLLVIDDVANISSSGLAKNKRRSYDGGSSQVSVLCGMGFVSVSYISSARAIVQVTSKPDGEDRCVDVELRDDLLVLETCADSTHTLMAALSGLSPPTEPSTAMKYRTKVMPMEDLLASLTGDAFATANNDTFDFAEDFGQELDSSLEESVEVDDEDNLGLDFGSQYSSQDSEAEYPEDPYVDHNPSVRLSTDLSSRDTYDGVLLESFSNREQILTSGEPLDFDEDHFETRSLYEDSALRWNSARAEYVRPAKPKGTKVKKNPFKIRVRDVHIIWNLFDGYDWQSTRDKITKKVQEVETKAIEKKARHDRLSAYEQEIEDEETVIGDMLFNSIYIGIPSNRDPRELAMAINQEINNGASETESIATTTLTSVSQRQSMTPRIKGRKLRLNRSKNHKITFELKGVNADIDVFPAGSGETLNSVNIRVHDFDIFDHVPTSTWKKFATYMHDAGEREKGSSMIHIELLNVKPDPDLTASELVIRVTILPLRLHVDQDALDFITRFFEFKDEDAMKPGTPGDVPFLQRVEINDVRVRLNYKPKRVDYAGIRSGHTTEFKNFVILDEADMVLKHAIVFGTSGFDKLGVTLNNIWTNDVKRNQLGGILGAIGPVKSLVNVGSGVRDLVVIPMREYKKDGRIVRSIRKGVVAFAKTTGMEVIKAGAKMAIGTQTALQGAEEFLNKKPTAQYVMSDDEDEDEEDQKRISPYATQPIGVMQGMRGGMRSLKRDLFMARDAIIAVPGEVMESGSAGGAAKAVFRRAPTVIIRPLMGVTGAIGQGLMGVNNSLDPGNKRRTDDQYKSG